MLKRNLNIKFKKETGVLDAVDPEDILENLVCVDSVLEDWHIWDNYPESKRHPGERTIMDPIADALIRIKNGYLIGKQSVTVKFSKLILQLVKLLEKEGYVQKVGQKDKEIIVTLKYTGRIPALTDVKRVSKPSLRVYKGVKALPIVLNGLGIAIISTPRGIMTDRQARRQKVGGEILAEVW